VRPDELSTARNEVPIPFRVGNSKENGSASPCLPDPSRASNAAHHHVDQPSSCGTVHNPNVSLIRDTPPLCRYQRATALYCAMT
jgi:hypothetical protein